MTHTFDSDVSLHYWLLWPTVRRAACAALGVIAQFFDIIFISRDGTKIDYKKTVAERLLQGNLHENCNDGKKKTRGEFFYYGKT